MGGGVDKFQIYYVDCIEMKCKNLQKINTIEIFYGITIDGEFSIEYNFHSIDFDK
jgi:hypothetical protein